MLYKEEWLTVQELAINGSAIAIIDKKMLQNKSNIYYTLRFASAMCFIGHGCFGIITKTIWCNYFAVFGIGHAAAYHLMPVVGTIDIICGLVILFYPLKVFPW